MSQKQNYYEKLQHPMWQKRRLEIMERAEFKCEECDNQDVQLNVHHLYYVTGRNPWQYPDWALKCLCKNCHTETHSLCDNESNEFCFMPFEDMFTWLEGKNSDYCVTWDLCAEFGMMRESNPQHFIAFTKKVLKFAQQARKEMEA
jgi:hypothetical protein